jgi:hypothetical protein
VGKEVATADLSRAERRRFDRELAATRVAPGTGHGWRLNSRGRRYPVREPGPVDVDRLVAESDAAAARLETGEVAHV